MLTYDPVNGRRLYVNGNFTGDVDPRAGGTLADWDDTFALVLGNETSNNRQWQGVIRFAAVHNRALTLEQIQQNFAAGVGERYFLLFNVTHAHRRAAELHHVRGQPVRQLQLPVQQADLHQPRSDARPGSIPIEGMRIGVNGAEAQIGPGLCNAEHARVTDANYTPATGQLLSEVGTIIGLQKGPVSDQFFLSFDRIGTQTYARTEPAPAHASRRRICARSRTSACAPSSSSTRACRDHRRADDQHRRAHTYLQVQQQLPPVPSIEAFLASHQTGVAQLAIKYCSVMVDNTTLRAGVLPRPERRRVGRQRSSHGGRQGHPDRAAAAEGRGQRTWRSQPDRQRSAHGARHLLIDRLATCRARAARNRRQGRLCRGAGQRRAVSAVTLMQ